MLCVFNNREQGQKEHATEIIVKLGGLVSLLLYDVFLACTRKESLSLVAALKKGLAEKLCWILGFRKTGGRLL